MRKIREEKARNALKVYDIMSELIINSLMFIFFYIPINYGHLLRAINKQLINLK
jgi:hypothetical protein